MNILSKRFLLGIATILTCCAICCAQDMALDFEHALRMVPKHQRWPSGIMYYDVREAANSFVGKYTGTSAVEFLQTKSEDPNSKKLALLSLARLAPADKTAENALYETIYGKSRASRDAITAIAYLDLDNGRGIAETLLTQPGPWRVRKAAVEMLVGLGDKHTLQILKQMVAGEKRPVVKKAFDSAIAELEYRLTEVSPDEQAKWARLEVTHWRTLRETPLSRATHAEKYVAAKTLHMQGKAFPREYLEYKLNIGDILAVWIIGNQKETWAVEGLKRRAAHKGALGESARSALAMIGTNEALRALEDLVVPGAHSNVFNHVMSLLRLYGDRASAELMRKLSSEERFSESERASLNITYEIIEKRLNKESSQ